MLLYGVTRHNELKQRRDNAVVMIPIWYDYLIIIKSLIHWLLHIQGLKIGLVCVGRWRCEKKRKPDIMTMSNEGFMSRENAQSLFGQEWPVCVMHK